jgi:hypothetical protein
MRLGDPFGERPLSRRRLLGGAAGVTGMIALGSRALKPLAAMAEPSSANPKPIPGGSFPGYHFFTPGRSNPADPSSPMNEPSTITDFDGVVAIMAAQGMGTLTDGQGSQGQRRPFEVDMRIMNGRYVGEDGRTYRGAFGFV